MEENGKKKMALIVSQGTLDWAYPPFILASTAAASDIETWMFFTFYGLPLLKKKLNAKVAPHANPAMPMKMPFGPKAFQKISWKIPNMISGFVPGFQTFATSMMKKTFKNNGVATIEELREMSMDAGVKMFGCQMTMDVFGFQRDEFIDGIEVCGAAAFLEYAVDADLQMFI